MLPRFWVAILIALWISPSEAHAQSAGEILQESPYIKTETDETRRKGADDSTTGTTRFANLARLTIFPQSLNWNCSETGGGWKILSISNEGDLGSGSVSLSLDGHSTFEMAGSCNNIGSDQTCDIQVRPRQVTGSTINATITAEPQYGDSASATLTARGTIARAGASGMVNVEGKGLDIRDIPVFPGDGFSASGICDCGSSDKTSVTYITWYNSASEVISSTPYVCGTGSGCSGPHEGSQSGTVPESTATARIVAHNRCGSNLTLEFCRNRGWGDSNPTPGDSFARINYQFQTYGCSF